MHLSSDSQLDGATCLVREGLRLQEGSTLLLLYQQDFSDAASCIIRAAEEAQLHIDARSFGREDFLHSYPEAFSPARLTQATPLPAGIVLLMEWSEETTGARLSLLKNLQGTGKKWRIASMPGVNLPGLAFCSSDLSIIEKRSKLVFAVLARSRRVIISTENPQGTKDTLNIPIGLHWPITSTGRIADGSWGNFPSGETFVVPNEYRASGTITIRGSFPRRPLAEDEWVRFTLRRGRVIPESIEASGDALRDDFKKLFFRGARTVRSKNANALAELGIGTNETIASLTGNPIFDEKKLGTVHIAFGRNDQFAGRLTGAPHHDVTCISATVEADGVAILEAGSFNLNETNAIPDLESFSPVPTSRGLRLSGTGVPSFSYVPPSSSDSEAAIVVTYLPSRGEPVSLRLSVGAQAGLVNDLLQQIYSKDSIAARDLLGFQPSLEEPMRIRRIVAGLLAFGLVECRK